MSVFLIDKESCYTYETLLNDINKAKVYYPHFKSVQLYNYFLNLVIALVANKPLFLIDSDSNESELVEIENNSINLPSPIERIDIKSIEDIFRLILVSQSEISIFTSGTTGQPKKVIHSIQNLIRSVRIDKKYSYHKWGFAYNPTHMAGIQVFFQAFLNMNTLVNIFNKSRSSIYDQIIKNRITHISATPTFYRLLLPIENEYKSIERITFGGEKSDKRLHDSILRIFPNSKINNIYASTEAGSLFSSNGENFHIPSNIRDKIKVVEDELQIHKSLLGKSNTFSFSGDFYPTGDLIEWINKQDGIFRFKSRKNELINIGGYKVNPIEVEYIIQNIPDIIQVMVYSKPNSVLGNILCADIKLSNSSQVTEVMIRNFLSDKIQDYKIPRRIKFVDSFSLTRSGKIKRI